MKYFTWLDFYLYFTFVYILLIGLEVGINQIINNLTSNTDDIDDDEDNEDINTGDYVLLIFNFVLWIVIHCIFYYKAKQAKNIELSKIYKSKFEIDDDDIVYSMQGKQDGKTNTMMYQSKPERNEFAKRAFVKTAFN